MPKLDYRKPRKKLFGLINRLEGESGSLGITILEGILIRTANEILKDTEAFKKEYEHGIFNPDFIIYVMETIKEELI